MPGMNEVNREKARKEISLISSPMDLPTTSCSPAVQTLHSNNKRATSQTGQKGTSTRAVKGIYLLDREATSLIWKAWIQNNVNTVAGAQFLDLAKAN